MSVPFPLTRCHSVDWCYEDYRETYSDISCRRHIQTDRDMWLMCYIQYRYYVTNINTQEIL